MQHATQRVHIGSRVDPAAADLFRGDVVERADPSPAAGRAAAGEHLLREPEVAQVDVPGRIDQQVRRLDVAVDETGPVDLVDRRAGLADDAGRFGDGEAAAVAHPAVQIRSGDETHGDVGDSVGLPGFIHRDDIRVIEAAAACASARKRCRTSSLSSSSGAITLSATIALERDLGRPVDHAHPPAADA